MKDTLTIEQIKLLVENFSIGNLNCQKIAIPIQNGYRLINVNQILYCTANDNYTNLITVNKESILVCKTLKAIEELLSCGLFFRIHKSTLINLNYIHSISLRNENTLTLENGEKFEIAMRRKDELEKLILQKFASSSFNEA